MVAEDQVHRLVILLHRVELVEEEMLELLEEIILEVLELLTLVVVVEVDRV